MTVKGREQFRNGQQEHVLANPEQFPRTEGEAPHHPRGAYALRAGGFTRSGLLGGLSHTTLDLRRATRVGCPQPGEGLIEH